MRVVNIVSALTGAFALIMLALLRHAGAGGDMSAVLIGGMLHLSAATAGLTVAGRSGKLNLIAIAMVLVGANIFAGVIYANALAPGHPFHALAPLGGGLQIIGWILLAFASPERR
ncbi:MAG: hypothetical protein NW206_01270 [Hyphomonadaceae bacterium]|nr:hypothetical protein [Hyphomonadaceae bacterium]